ncbi:uncharacterized protein [Prorops nasuta]|uniref:uncharacterized protein n=1 Tax=Prorops nasuta TaxID=863751 RepID=UPI0034CDADFD
MGSHPTLGNFVEKLIELIKIYNIEIAQIDRGHGKNIVHKRKYSRSFQNWLLDDEGGWAFLEKSLAGCTSEKEKLQYIHNFINTSVLLNQTVILQIKKLLKNQELLFKNIDSSKIKKLTLGNLKGLLLLNLN